MDKEVIVTEEEKIKIQIFKFYPPQKQMEDDKWVTYYKTVLLANGEENLDRNIVQYVQEFYSKNSLEEILSDIDESKKIAYRKLTKIGVRTQWAYLCISEWKKALSENREPIYAEFPTLKA